ncbi:hypothetical protein [Puniceibacterium sp. IMCC21224]|uniref:hypothetical protein n=1 Tax=Puniceibacterium sp. IMCC21224 TaxID=1618204 RepID=UPI00064DF670|nr:hypothetical protein [Puniceibacterium sp. IMCC21224]KMK65115.1 Peptidase family M50 [Puniceibacterium sp. IMCC21224]
MLNDLTLSQIGMRLVAIVIIAGLHGAAVAGAAVLLGDRGPRHDGRLTAVPIVHLDLFGALAAVVTGIGWTRPVAIDPGAMRSGRAGLVVVVFAGTVALVVTALVCLALVRPALEGLPYTTALTAAAVLRTAARMCLWMAILNLLPIPPLTGAHLLAAVGLKVPVQAVWVTTALLLVLLTTGVLQSVLMPVFALLSLTVTNG